MLCKVTLHPGHALANTRPIQLCWYGQEMGTNNLLDKMHASNVFVQKMPIEFLLMDGNDYKCWCQCLTQWHTKC